MMLRTKRFFYRIAEVLDYRTFVVATAFLVVALFGYGLIAGLQSVHASSEAAKRATDAANRRGEAATRRIDLLNQQIKELQALIATGRDERGQLATTVAALSEQVRRSGGTPIVMVTVQARPTATSTRPSPRPTASASPTRVPTSTPTPSPTRSCLVPFLC